MAEQRTLNVSLAVLLLVPFVAFLVGTVWPRGTHLVRLSDETYGIQRCHFFGRYGCTVFQQKSLEDAEHMYHFWTDPEPPQPSIAEVLK